LLKRRLAEGATSASSNIGTRRSSRTGTDNGCNSVQVRFKREVAAGSICEVGVRVKQVRARADEERSTKKDQAEDHDDWDNDADKSGDHRQLS
jgi:hypothetical protein